MFTVPMVFGNVTAGVFVTVCTAGVFCVLAIVCLTFVLSDNRIIASEKILRFSLAMCLV